MATALTRVAVIGTGFWAPYQIAAWREAGGAEVVAVCGRSRAKAEEFARRLNVPAAYDSADEMLRRERPDVFDVITGVESHAEFVHLAAAHKVPVICQKPLAPTLETAEVMVAACRSAGVPLYVHENWRWQAPIRALKRELERGVIGRVFRARVSFVSGFPVFANQPFLRELEQFILTDIGTHVLDAARFLFGEADRLYCQTHRVHRDIRGEDVATVILSTGNATVTAEMAYAENPLEREAFPQTMVFVEGERGSAELAPDYWVRVTTAGGTHARRHPPPRYEWANPAYDVVQASGVPLIQNLLAGLRGEGRAETTGEDNLKTLRLVFAAYESARTGRAIQLADFGRERSGA